MKAKRSIVLLSGLLLLTMAIAWAESPQADAPTCPAVTDEQLHNMMIPTAWARADWNAETERWVIDCRSLDAAANMGMGIRVNAMSNAVGNARYSNANATSPRRRPANRPNN